MRIQVLRSITHPASQTPKLRLHFCSMADTVRPNFCEDEDESKLMTETTALLKSRWSLDDTQQGLKKTFNFPTYAKALVSLLFPCRHLTELTFE